MAGAPRPSSRSRQTWRERSRRSESAAEAKNLRRWLLSVLFFVLVGALAWQLWLSFLPQARIAYLGVSDYKALTVPPIPFARDDLLAFDRALENLEDLRDYETGDSMSRLGTRLKEMNFRSRDSLILYLSAHGISLGGKGYLLCSDFLQDTPLRNPRGDTGGVVEIGELLEQLREVPAREKIVLVDAGHLPTDPHLGAVVNEFPRLLAEAVRQTGDAHLWVLAANGLHESSHVSEALHRTVFNSFVARGLSLEADADGDRIVDLSELVTFVSSGVDDWVAKHELGDAQRPQIVWGGGDADLPTLEKQMRDIRLPVKRKPKPPEPAANDKNAPSTKAAALGGNRPWIARSDLGSSLLAVTPRLLAQTQPTAATSTNSQTAPAPQPSSGDPAAKAPDPPKTDSKPTPDPQAGDAKQPDTKAPDAAKAVVPSTGDKSAASPATAPPAAKPDAAKGPPDPLAALREAWRQRDEQLQRSGEFGWTPIDYAPHLWREYEDLLLNYETRYRAHFYTGEKFEPQALADSFLALVSKVTRNLVAARGEFLACSVCQGLQKPDSAVLRAAIQNRNDCIYRAADLVAWHARAGRGARIKNIHYDNIFSFVQQLVLFDRMLRAAVGGSPEEDRRVEPAELKREADALVAKKIEIEHALDSGLNTNRIKNDLLATALVPGPRRLEILGELEKTGKGLEAAPARNDIPQAADAGWAWERGKEQLELETVLMALVARGDSPARLTATPVAIRDAGTNLSEFYRELPERFLKNLGDAADQQRLRLADRELRLLGSREGRALTAQSRLPIADLNPIPKLQWSLRPPQGFEFVGLKDKLAFGPGGDWQEVTGQLRSSEGFKGEISLAPDFEPGQLEVLDLARNSRPAAVQDKVAIAPDRPIELRYKLRPKNPDTPRSVEFVLKAVSRSGQRAQWRIDCDVPASERIDLMVAEASDPAKDVLSHEKSDQARLLTFARHPNWFVFKLKQHTKSPRTLSVQLLTAGAAGEQKLKELRELARTKPAELVRAGAMELASLKDFKLSDTEARQVPFPQFPPPVKEAPPAAAAAPAAPAVKKPPPAINGGLICVVTDEQARWWVTWIDLAPMLPKDYVADPVVNYSRDTQEVTVDLALSGDRLPSEPVSVVWDVPADLPGVPTKSEVSLTRDHGDKIQAVNIAPELNKRLEIRLAVDGYPRAFVFDRTLNSDPARPKNDQREVFIDEPKPGAAFGVTAVDGQNRIIVGPIRARITAPNYAFAENREDRVEIGIDENGDRELDSSELFRNGTTFHADRQIEMTLTQISPDNRVGIGTQVKDFELDLNCEPLNKKVNLIAQLVLNGVVRASKSVEIMLDRGNPQISYARFVRQVPQGARVVTQEVGTLYQGDPPALLKVTASDDLSGVKKVTYIDDKDNNGRLDDEEKKDAKFTEIRDDQTQTFTLEWKPEKIGDHVLWVEATDNVGLVSAVKKVPIRVEIKPPEPAAGKAAMPAGPQGVIEGVVSYGGPVGKIQVQLKGPAGEKTATSGADGTFSFKQLPPGDYTLSAEGIAKNSLRKGTGTATVPANSKAPVKVSVNLK